ncbi:MAG: energy transducer TonB [Acidobacteriaceae bacterium]|nr:energy transducer TonB [Acidobacteriaceae bacterium]
MSVRSKRMFDQTFVNGKRDSKKPSAILLSLLLQIAAMCGMVVIPLIYSEALPSTQLRSLLFAPPPSLVEPPHQTLAKVQPRVARSFNLRVAVSPLVTPGPLFRIQSVSPVPEIGIPAGTGEQNAGIPGVDQIVRGFEGDLLTPQIPAAKHKAAGPVRIGGQIAQANLIQEVQPVYPSLAKAARVQGRVEFTAIISKDGRIENLQLVAGHPLLVNAAREAVLQWRYRPTLLNGEPVEVVTDIVVNFSLNP